MDLRDEYPSIAAKARARVSYGTSCVKTTVGHTSAYGLSDWIFKMSDGVAAANLAAADSDPILPQSYEFTPHWSRIKGTGNTILDDKFEC